MAKLLSGTRIYGNAAVDTFLTVAGNIAAGNISVNIISANTWLGLSTSNVTEGLNLYFTNARVYSNVISLLNAKANVADLTTSNVVEGNNLYYTNARVLAHLQVSNVFVANLISNDVLKGNTLIMRDVNVTNAVVAAAGEYDTGNIRTIATNNLVSNTIASNTWNNLYTANVIESDTNLYYTNARVLAHLQSSNVFVANLISNDVIKGNTLIIQDVNVTRAVIAVAGEYESGNIGAARTTSLVANTITSNIWNNLYTANVIESASNLYYTNARVLAHLQVSNVYVSNLISGDVLKGNTLIMRDVNVTNAVVAAAGEYDTGNIRTIATTNLVANTITSNIWNNLYTANVIESDNNLYYTNARVRSTLSGGTGVSYDTTTGVIALAQNVSPSSSVTFASLSVTGNTVFYGNVITHSANNLSVSDNMIYLNAGAEEYTNPDIGFAAGYNDGTYHHTGFFRDASDGRYKVFYNYQPEPDANIFINTDDASFRLANIQADNFFGNVVGLVSSISNFTTSNLAEGTNLYFTNARVYANVIGLLNTKANVVDLTTSNVVEGNNLYYTNARVMAQLQVSNVYVANLISNDVLKGNTLIIRDVNVTNSVVAAAGEYTTGNIRTIATTNLVANSITSNIWNNLYTGNILESANNPFFTNARVVTAVTNSQLANLSVTSNILLGNGVGGYISGLQQLASNVITANTITMTGTGTPTLQSNSSIYLVASAGANAVIVYSSNLNVNGNVNAEGIVANSISATRWTNLFTANVTESVSSLYYTNARVYSNVIGLLSAKANVVDLTTSNVVELNNLYYTNARVYSNVIGLFTAKANVVDLTSANIVELNNLYYTNARVYSNVIGLLTAKANVVDLTSANIAELNNLYYTNARVYSNVINLLTNKANVSDLTTSNVVEGNNLYYTNARVYSNVITLLSGYATVSNLNLKANVVDLTSANIAELNNLYYTNARVYSNVISLLNLKANVSDLTTSNIVEGTNLYYTNSRVRSNVIALLPTLAGPGIIIAANGQISANTTSTTSTFTGDITVSGNVVANGLIIRGIEVTDSVLAGNITSSSSSANIIASNTITTHSITSNIWYNLYTANVAESASNLYYTNARVRSNVISLLPTLAGYGINIAANGQISADVSNVSVTGGPAITDYQIITGGNSVYTLSKLVDSANVILVSINGMVQIPTLDYTVAGSQTLTFAANTPTNATIEVKYLGSAAFAVNTTVITSSTILPTIEGTTNYMMGGSISSAKMAVVSIDGLVQRPDIDYTVSGTQLSFVTAPPSGSNIEIRLFGQEAVALAGATNTTAYISNSMTFAGGSSVINLGSNVSYARNIIVTVDGISQIPDLDYTVSGSTLTLVGTPSINSLVEVKFFGAEAFTPNLTYGMVNTALATAFAGNVTISNLNVTGSITGSSSSSAARALGYSLVFGG